MHSGLRLSSYVFGETPRRLPSGSRNYASESTLWAREIRPSINPHLFCKTYVVDATYGDVGFEPGKRIAQ
jgi:hypothetical protein